MITYEVDRALHRQDREEEFFAPWIAEVGGFWAIFTVLLNMIDWLDDVELYVIADLIQPYKSKFLKRETVKIGTKNDDGD